MKNLTFITFTILSIISFSQDRYRIFTSEEIGGSFTPNLESVKKIESLIKEREPSLWKNSVRQYMGNIHPKSGRNIVVQMIPCDSLSDRLYRVWRKQWVLVSDDPNIRKAYYSIENDSLNIVPKNKW